MGVEKSEEECHRSLASTGVRLSEVIRSAPGYSVHK